MRLRCTCGKLHYSEFVPGVDEVVQYGPNIRALAVHLTQGDLVPLARSSELLRSLYGLEISPATICAWIEDAAQRVTPSVEAMKQSVQAAAVVGARDDFQIACRNSVLLAEHLRRQVLVVRG